MATSSLVDAISVYENAFTKSEKILYKFLKEKIDQFKTQEIKFRGQESNQRNARKDKIIRSLIGKNERDGKRERDENEWN